MEALIGYLFQEIKVLSGAPILSIILLIIGFLLGRLFYRELLKVSNEQSKNDKKKIIEEKAKVKILLDELREKDDIFKSLELGKLMAEQNNKSNT